MGVICECLLDAQAQVGESPVWSALEQKLWWVDIEGQALHRFDPHTRALEQWPMPSEPACLALERAGSVVIALRDGVYRFDPLQGQLTLIAPSAYDRATTRFNDGRCDRMGRFWVGSMFEPRSAPAGALYRLGQGTLARVVGDVTVANGLAFSPDGRTLYWADSPARRIDCFDFDAERGTLANRRVFYQFAPDEGRPDGAAVDREGNYWCALYAGGMVVKIAPDGQRLLQIPLPVRRPTMVAFGGAALDQLFVTSARAGADAAELAQYPLSGGLFCLSVGAVGLAEPYCIV